MGSVALVLVWSHPSVIAVRAYFMSVQRRERSQPQRDRASDCGPAEPATIESEGPAGSARRVGIGKKNCFSGGKVQRRERSQPQTDRPAIVGSAEPATIECEGPAGSARRGGIGKKNCFSGGKGSDRNHGGIRPAIVASAEQAAIECEGPAGSARRGGIGKKIASAAGRVLVWSHPSAIAVRAYLMSVQRRERSQPRRDRASDCGVRGAGGDRKRGASGERSEGRDREKNCFSGGKVIAVRAYLMSVQRRERSQPRRDRASDCGVRGAGGDRKRGASGERSEGRDREKNCFSGGKVIAVRAYLMSVQRGERSQLRRDRASDCGVRGAGGDRKRGASGERSEGRDREKKLLQRREGPAQGAIATAEGPASDCGVRGADGDRMRGASGECSEGRDREKKLLKRREGKKNLLVWSHPSVIAVRAYLMSVQRRERSQPPRDRASDCGVRGAGGDRKRGASGERSEGRDREKKLLQRREGVGSDRNRGGTGPAIVGSAESAAIESEGPAGSTRRGGIGKKIASAARRVIKKIVQKEKRGATRGLPWGSAILVLLSSKHAQLRSSDGIRCVSAGMVTPVSNCGPSVFDVNPAQGAITTA
ncbi:Hypothetical predicted protein [Olea europaea subsp. europaea]|uniref:Uncharacterized protein n=1 Tax=Olea europaea subsp. europaea TaxID=158383 RepID=A0A8S0RPP7_OLEEU|nr:Hypothetical predicted protein [Olea europaea subsp. europaea]